MISKPSHEFEGITQRRQTNFDKTSATTAAIQHVHTRVYIMIDNIVTTAQKKRLKHKNINAPRLVWQRWIYKEIPLPELSRRGILIEKSAATYSPAGMQYHRRARA